MAAYLIFFLLFYLPLIVIPLGISPFEIPKVILAEFAIEILLFLRLIKFRKNHFKYLYNPQIIFLGILFILSLDTGILFQPKGAFFGNLFRLQGQFLLWHLLLFSLLSKYVKLDRIPKFLYYFSFILLALSTIILGVNENKRAFGTLGEPNALATTILFIFPFIYYKFKPLRFASLLTTFLIILLSGSRAGLIGFIIQLIFIAIASRSKEGKLSKATIISLILISLSATLPFMENAGWFENRSSIWQTSFISGLSSPFIGHGFGNIQNIIHQTAASLNNNVQYQVVDSSHNFLLDYWIQGGLVAVISILMLIGLSLQGLISTKKSVELTAMLGLITAMLFNPVSVVNLLAFWWLISQGFTHQEQG